jgi:hypothetical protein
MITAAITPTTNICPATLLKKPDVMGDLPHRNIVGFSFLCDAPTGVRFTPDSDRESGFLRKVMSALPLKADVCGATVHVR